MLSFLLLGFGLTTLFAVSTLVLRARAEAGLVDDWLQQEARNFVAFKRENPDPGANYTLSAQAIELLIARPTSPSIPFEWAALKTGVYDLRDPDAVGRDANYKLAVERQADMVGFLRYNTGNQTLDLQQLLVLLGGSVVLFTLFAWLIGLWSSRRVIRPVADLAARVGRFRGQSRPDRLAPHFEDDEVGQLASALDDYADQLTERVTRDREFNADVSHELRTPLAVIRGATELLLAAPDLSEKMRQRLLRIDRATQQCTDLTTALLMLSRNERGSGNTDIRRLVEQQVDANRLHLANKPVTVRAEGQSDVHIDAPEAVLAVALGNLIGNACKYTPSGEVVVTVLADRVEVADTGPGISVEDAERLFERGYRGSSSEGSKGAGIGLAIVRRLCELYGWRASIRPRDDMAGAIATLEFEPYRKR
ncbi:signal transduction histidine kinase [Chiayiivirga flava]|uniref:histidine kinase n=1 Tax=Chiayiivirga flava TaxID=659595 RepID=A0A7W8D8X7_9GAMM|nr:signal transduction histidine kinase [Chiayiivirga flava]